MSSSRLLALSCATCALLVTQVRAQGVSGLFQGQTITPKKSAAQRPAQSSLARHGAFLTVSSKDPAFIHAIPAANLAAVRAKLNHSATFSGTVVKVYLSKSNAHVLLDFAPNYRSAGVGLIDAKNFRQFPDLRQLTGKRVLVSGRVLTFKDQTQIDLASPSAIRLVK